MNVAELFKCFLSGLPEHFVQEPKLLSCGHPVCAVCIDKHEAEDDDILCVQCNQVNSYIMDTEFVRNTKTIFESNLKHFSRILYEKIVSKQNELTEIEVSLKNKIENQFEFIEGEIEIAIESLKAKLDDINASFKTKLRESKEKVVKLLLDPIDEIKEKTEMFNQHIQSNSFDLETFYDNNSNLLNIGLLLEKLKNFKLEVQFEFNEKFDEDSVGSFSCNIDDYIDKTPTGVLETEKHEYIELDYGPSRIVELKNKNILVGSSADELLALYDSKFKLIRKITEINNDIFYLYRHNCEDSWVFEHPLLSK